MSEEKERGMRLEHFSLAAKTGADFLFESVVNH
jgi:hypothetical protein